MSRLNDFLAEVEKQDLKTNVNANGTITIQQTQRNELRAKVVEEFYNFLLEQKLDVFMTNGGIVIALENENIGTISLELKIAFKSLDFDPLKEADIYEFERNEKLKKIEQRAKAKARKIAADEARRALNKASR